MNLSEFKEKISLCDPETKENIWNSDGASDDLIGKTEHSLGFFLNSDYKEFLKEFGNIDVAGDYFYGLNEKKGYDYANLDLVTKEFKEKTGLKLEKKTLLQNEDDEFYLFVDNENGKIISYDPFSKEFDEVGENIFSYVGEIVDDHNLFVLEGSTF